MQKLKLWRRRWSRSDEYRRLVCDVAGSAGAGYVRPGRNLCAGRRCVSPALHRPAAGGPHLDWPDDGRNCASSRDAARRQFAGFTGRERFAPSVFDASGTERSALADAPATRDSPSGHHRYVRLLRSTAGGEVGFTQWQAVHNASRCYRASSRRGTGCANQRESYFCAGR
ncbi:hypothetical protein D3C81_1679090 [compost metagenome]